MKCPGQDTRYWKPGDIFEADCPHCGRAVEFFKDEATRKCRACRQVVVNPKMDFGCATYCKYAAECLGELSPELLAKREDLLKDRVALETKRELGNDFQRVAHAVKVARYAEEIAKEEKAEQAVVLSASYLHVLHEGRGTEAPRTGSGKEPREILEGLGARPELVEKVLDIVNAFRNGRVADSVAGRVFSDAHLLAALDEEKAAGRGEIDGQSQRQLFSEAARKAASRLLSRKAAG